ncbi:MAG TPA: ABC transporter permease [Gemmatimonadales bacterium]
MATPVFSDLREAVRGLLRAPVISGSAILCLALGLGSTTAIASAIDRALLQPPPFRDPGQIVDVYRTAPQGNNWPFSNGTYYDLANNTRQLTGIAAISYGTSLLTLPNDALQEQSLYVTGNLFPILGVRAQVGRLLTPADEDPGQTPVAVLGDKLWQTRFGGDPAIVGKPILLNGQQVIVVGIAPKDFRIPRGGGVLESQLWLPLRLTPQQRASRGSNYLSAFGRLAPGATIGSAQAEMNRLFAGVVAVYPDARGEGVRIAPLQAEAVAAVRTPLLLTFGAVLMVLLIAVTNVASLLLARGVQRRRVTAIRAALGASRWNIMRPVLMESVVLAGAGLLVGLALAWAGVQTIGALAAQRLPQLAGLHIDYRIVGVAVAIALVAAVGCAAAPAWRTLSVDPQSALSGGRGGGMGRDQHRALGALVVVEVALSLVLILGAGLVLKGFSRLTGNSPGFDPDEILTLQATVSRQAYPDSDAKINRFVTPVIAAIEQVPGVAAAASIQLLPYQSWGWNFNIRYEGQPATDMTRLPLAEIRIVTPGFFQVTQQRLIAGRLLRESDDDRPSSQAVAVVNQALVKRDFHGRDPIGARFYFGDTGLTTIVGVVSDIRNVGPYNPPSPELYATYLQGQLGTAAFPIMVRVRHGDPTAIAPAVRAAIRRVDPTAAVTDVQPINDIIALSVGQPRFYLILLGTFAIVAGVLAVAGLYGVLGYSVAQRTRELGIRNALGSSTGGLMRLVARQGVTLVAIGVAIGLAGAVVLTRLLTRMLYGVSPLDLPTWIAASTVLIASGVGATLIPSFRATRVDPLTAMRVE